MGVFSVILMGIPTSYDEPQLNNVIPKTNNTLCGVADMLITLNFCLLNHYKVVTSRDTGCTLILWVNDILLVSLAGA